MTEIITLITIAITLRAAIKTINYIDSKIPGPKKLQPRNQQLRQYPWTNWFYDQ